MQHTQPSPALQTKSKKPRAEKCSATCGAQAAHPDHRAVVARLNRAAGQIRGVSQMIEDRRYCVDILTQVKAAQSALRSIEAEIMEKHIRSCIQDAFNARNPREMEKKIQELVKLMT